MSSIDLLDEKTRESIAQDDAGVDSQTRKKAQKLRRHCARFWCYYCVFAVTFSAVFLPIFFLVVIPAIAQLVVNKSTLRLVSVTVLEPRPDSVLLSIQSALDLPIALPVRIEPITMEVFNRDMPENNTFAKVYIDGTTVKGNTTLGVADQRTPLDADQWAHYVRQVLFTANAPLSVRGTTNAFLGKLKSHVHLNKDIHQTTLDSFAGFSIENPELLLPARDDGTNLIANATLPNPSVMTLQIGTTLLDLKTGPYTLGNATLDNLYLRPGNNTTPISGIIDLPYLIDHLGAILATQGDALGHGFLRLEAVTRSVTFEGVEVPYYTEAMRELPLTAQVPLAPLVLNTLHNVIAPNGTNIFRNLTDPDGPTSIRDIIASIDDPDGSLGLN